MKTTNSSTTIHTLRFTGDVKPGWRYEPRGHMNAQQQHKLSLCPYCHLTGLIASRFPSRLPRLRSERNPECAFCGGSGRYAVRAPVGGDSRWITTLVKIAVIGACLYFGAWFLWR